MLASDTAQIERIELIPRFAHYCSAVVLMRLSVHSALVIITQLSSQRSGTGTAHKPVQRNPDSQKVGGIQRIP